MCFSERMTYNSEAHIKANRSSCSHFQEHWHYLEHCCACRVWKSLAKVPLFQGHVSLVQSDWVAGSQTAEQRAQFSWMSGTCLRVLTLPFSYVINSMLVALLGWQKVSPTHSAEQAAVWRKCHLNLRILFVERRWLLTFIVLLIVISVSVFSFLFKHN